MSLFVNNLTDIQPAAVDKVDIPLGEWLPDQAAVNNQGVLEALNVLPLDDGSYGPFPSLLADGLSGMPDTVHGAASVLMSSNIQQVFAGTSNGIYTRVGNTPFALLDGVAVNQNYAWQFIPFKTLMVFLHQDIFPLKSIIGTTTTPLSVGGTPPRAACGAMVGDFLVLGNLLDDPDDAHTVAPNRIRWSGIKNIDANWVTDNTTQADYNDMPPEGGAVIAIAGRTNLLVFQERKISFGRYVNLPSVWDIETVEEDVGCIARDSVVSVGAYKLFIAEDGFRAWNGTNSERIGDGKVDKYFFSQLQYDFRGRIVGAYDKVSGCVLWAFPNSRDGSLGEIIIYSLRANRFTHSIQTVEALFAGYTSNISVDDLTGLSDTDTRYVDDPSFSSGGRSLLAAFTQGHLYGTFTGPSMAATFDTAEFTGPTSDRVLANLARPLVDLLSPVATIQPYGRDQLAGGVLTSFAETAQEIDGNCPILAEARYLRFRTRIPAGASWKHAQGIEIARKAGGKF